MEGKDKIIDDILSSAKQTAAAMLEEASAEQTATLDALRAELEAEAKEQAQKGEAAADAVYRGKVKLGELEVSKVLLKAKQDCVAAVYDGVKQRLLSAPDAQYLDILAKLIARSCEDGDVVIAARADAKRVTAAWVKKLSASLKKKLTLSDEYGDFSGGVILRNDRFDTDLTADEIIAELKERTLADTVSRLGL